MLKGAWRYALWGCAAALGIAAIAAFTWWQGRREAPFEMYVFDTPGAPSALVRTPNDRRILINGGSNSDIVRRITRVLPFYSRRIDLVIATEADGKHASGLIDILDRYDVGRAVGLASSADTVYKAFQKAANGLDEVVAGDVLELDDAVTAEVLFPLPPERFKYSNASQPQLILRIRFGETSFVIAGQATDKILKVVGLEGKGAASSSSSALIFGRKINGLKIKKAGTALIVSDGRTVQIRWI